MSVFSFTNPLTGKRFEIEGPPTLTETEARRIFEEQLNAGALVGLKPGDVLDSARQALDGVAGAAGQLAQQVQNVAGSASGALTGALQQAQGAVAGLGQQATQFASALPSAINSATSVASKALTGITTSVAGLVPTNPINVADLAKQATALLPVQGLPQLDVRAAMSQATNLVGQASTALSNIGAGKFGFDAKQLELGGVLKPGMAALVGQVNAATGQINSLTSVLSSPAAFTGKLGIGKVDDLLGSVAKQDLLQQDLMNKGLNAVSELGIPVNKLDPGALAGTALNAAKSVTDTFNWATGGNLPADIKAQLDQVARDASFAVDFVNSKLNDAVTQEAEPGASEDTANRDTVDAAVTRVTGDAKIPPVNFGAVAVQSKTFLSVSNEIRRLNLAFDRYTTDVLDPILRSQPARVANRDSATPDVTKLVADLKLLEQGEADTRAFESRFLAVQRRADAFKEEFDQEPLLYSDIARIEQKIKQYLIGFEQSIPKYKARLEALST